jgi:hypothetical protein
MLMDYYKNAIVRVLQIKDPLEHCLKEVNNKALSLCLQSYSISDMDIIGREENGGTFAFCIVVD